MRRSLPAAPEGHNDSHVPASRAPSNPRMDSKPLVRGPVKSGRLYRRRSLPETPTDVSSPPTPSNAGGTPATSARNQHASDCDGVGADIAPGAPLESTRRNDPPPPTLPTDAMVADQAALDAARRLVERLEAKLAMQAVPHTGTSILTPADFVQQELEKQQRRQQGSDANRNADADANAGSIGSISSRKKGGGGSRRRSRSSSTAGDHASADSEVRCTAATTNTNTTAHANTTANSNTTANTANTGPNSNTTTNTNTNVVTGRHSSPPVQSYSPSPPLPPTPTTPTNAPLLDYLWGSPPPAAPPGTTPTAAAAADVAAPPPLSDYLWGGLKSAGVATSSGGVVRPLSLHAHAADDLAAAGAAYATLRDTGRVECTDDDDETDRASIVLPITPPDGDGVAVDHAGDEAARFDDDGGVREFLRLEAGVFSHDDDCQHDAAGAVGAAGAAGATASYANYPAITRMLQAAANELNGASASTSSVDGSSCAVDGEGALALPLPPATVKRRGIPQLSPSRPAKMEVIPETGRGESCESPHRDGLRRSGSSGKLYSPRRSLLPVLASRIHSGSSDGGSVGTRSGASDDDDDGDDNGNINVGTALVVKEGPEPGACSSALKLNPSATAFAMNPPPTVRTSPAGRAIPAVTPLKLDSVEHKAVHSDHDRAVPSVRSPATPLPPTPVTCSAAEKRDDALRVDAEIAAEPENLQPAFESKEREVLLAAHRGNATDVIRLHAELTAARNSSSSGGRGDGGDSTADNSAPTYNEADAAAALWLAAQSGHATVVNTLLDHCSVNIDVSNADLGTALLVAAQNGHLPVVQALLARDADVEIPDPYGVTPLFMAAKNKRLGCVRLLADAGARVDAPRWTDGVTPLLMAAQSGHVAVVEELVNRGADLDQVCTDDGQSALYAAVRKGRASVVRVLCENGAAIMNPRSNHGDTPLHCAAYWGNLNCVKILGAYGAPLDTPDYDGDTALDAAQEAGKRGVPTAIWLESVSAFAPLQYAWWGLEGYALRRDRAPFRMSLRARSTRSSPVSHQNEVVDVVDTFSRPPSSPTAFLPCG